MKKLFISRTNLMAFFVFAAMMAWAAMATADIGISGDEDKIPGLEQSFYLDGSSYITIGFTSPFEIYYDPTKGPWRKTFNDFTWPFNITENLHVAQGEPWTDWDEEILTEGWIWASDPLPKVVLSGQVSGTVYGEISADGQTVVFDFSSTPLPQCTYLTITKTLVWAAGGEGGRVDGPVTIDQWPTIPEPGTLVLLLSGAATLAVVFRRRR